MPYSDSNPERRNLTVLSLAIIVYYLAGGQFLNGEVNLMLINAKFNNPAMLVVFVWIMLCWFAFRYFVTSTQPDKHMMGTTTLDNDVYVNMNNYVIKKYLKDTKPNTLIDPLKTVCVYFNKGDNSYYLKTGDHHIKLKGISGYAIRTYYMLKIIFKHRVTTDYYTPYLLFFWAVWLGIYNYYWKSPC